MATTLGMVAHHGYELGAGAGLMFQRELGLTGASLAWGTVAPALTALAACGGRHGDDMLAFAAGTNLAAVTVHYTLWSWRLWPFRCCGIPVLTSAEGLAAGHLPAYNTVLLGWGAAAAASVCRSTPRMRWWAVAGFLAALPLRHHARSHFAWMRQQAKSHPAWWNRALAVRASPSSSDRRR